MALTAVRVNRRTYHITTIGAVEDDIQAALSHGLFQFRAYGAWGNGLVTAPQLAQCALRYYLSQGFGQGRLSEVVAFLVVLTVFTNKVSVGFRVVSENGLTRGKLSGKACIDLSSLFTAR